MIETFHFTQGMNRRKGRLYLDEGEMYTCDNFSMEHEGVLEARTAKTQSNAIDTDSASIINGIHRYIDSVLASSRANCYGTDAQFTADGVTQPTFNYIYQRDKDASSWSNIGILAGNSRPRFADYEKFIFAVDGESKRAYIDAKEYEWGVANPEVAPIVSVSAVAGNPDGTYTCVITFVVEFPNGKQYETAASPSASVSPSADEISWDNIPTCPYSGDELVIRRNLYRAVSGTYYLVATISDNTTTTYTDNVSDTTLQTKTAYSTTNYSTPPTNPVDVLTYLNRVWAVKDNTLYPSEAYAPFAFKTTTSMVVCKDDEDIVGIIDWADQLFIATKERWYRLQGTDADSWAVRRTFADHGAVNRHTIQKTKQGIICLDYVGVYLFNGYTCQNLTELKLGRDFITGLDDLSVCYSEYDGEIYYLYYASSGSTVDSCLKIDFTHGHPNLQMYLCDYVDAHELHLESSTRYQVLDGYEYTVGGTETIDTTVITRDVAFGNIGKLKNLRYLYYDIDTGGVDVTVTYYIDGTASSYTETLNTSSRTRKRSAILPQEEGYRFSLGITCADAQDVVIYSPWVLEATPVGD